MAIFKCSDCGYCFSDPRYSGTFYICVGCGATVNQTTDIDLAQIMTGGKLFEELFKEKLKALCLQYDYIYGQYPENAYEGKSLYDFYRYKIDKIDITNKDWIKEAYEKFAEEKGES